MGVSRRDSPMVNKTTPALALRPIERGESLEMHQGKKNNMVVAPGGGGGVTFLFCGSVGDGECRT